MIKKEINKSLDEEPITVGELLEFLSDLPKDMLIATGYRGTAYKSKFGAVGRARVVYIRNPAEAEDGGNYYKAAPRIEKNSVDAETWAGIYNHPIVLLED